MSEKSDTFELFNECNSHLDFEYCSFEFNKLFQLFFNGYVQLIFGQAPAT